MVMSMGFGSTTYTYIREVGVGYHFWLPFPACIASGFGGIVEEMAWPGT
jgi:hypothetical protein